MKKIFALMLVLLFIVSTMTSCDESGTESNSKYEDAFPILQFGITSEDVTVDGVYIGSTCSYDGYYVFNSYFTDGYLVFLSTMEGKIEIIDISQSGSSFYVTYKLIDNNDNIN